MGDFIVDDSEDEKPSKRKGRKTSGPLMDVEVLISFLNIRKLSTHRNFIVVPNHP